MTAVKERIIGAVSLMNDKEAENLWLLIQNHYVISPKTWNDIESVEPDEIDLRMLHEIENDPECREFVSSADAGYVPEQIDLQRDSISKKSE